MSYEDYIKELARLKEANENRIIAVIPGMQDFAYQSLIDWMEQSLDIKNGNIVTSPETVDILNQFDSYFLNALNSFRPYNGAVSSFLKELPKMGNVIQVFQASAIDVGPTQELVSNEILKAFTDNGLNQEFVQPLRDLLYQNIAAGTNFRQAKASLHDTAKGKLRKYLTQTAQQSVDSYAGMINKRLMDTYDYGYLLISGSLIQSSSPQCRFAINKLHGQISKEAWTNELEPLAEEHGLIEGTTFKNLPFNKLHWGCRHEFTPSMTQIKNAAA